MSKFSIVIPHYGQSSTLAKCIGSIKDQDYKDREIIVVLDGKDRSAENILKTHNDVIVEYTDKAKSGAPVARNRGANKATGDYLLFLDADSYLLPGALSHWSEAFDEHPDCGFVYSGYRIAGAGQSYSSEEFDKYHLETNNYIDTSNPLRREVYKPWLENLKSLQDWAFWLRLVRDGVKGHYLPNYIYVEKEPPREGSISMGAVDHYMDRRKAVQSALKLPVRHIAITSFAAIHHAKRVAKLIDVDFVDPMQLYMKPHEYKLIYMLGLFIGNSQQNFMPYMNSKDGMIRKDVVKVVHWIGTDILHMQTKASFADLNKIREPYNTKLVQLCQTKDNLEELESMGLHSELLPLPIEINTDVPNMPRPKNFTVAIYDHGTSQEDIYNQAFMNEIIKAMPDCKFLYFGAPNMKGREKNVTFLGRCSDIDDVIRKSSCLLRITRHDGFPVTPIEFLNRNRAVVTNVNMDYCSHIDFKDELTDANISKIKQSVIGSIRKIRANYPGVNLFENARKHYRELLDPKNLRQKLESLIN